MPGTSPSKLQARYARAVLTKNLGVKPGEKVIIEGWTHSLPWSIALAREARRLKALPLIVYEDEDAYWDSIEAGEEKLLGAAPAHEWAALGKTDVYIHMWGAGDRIRMSKLPEDRVRKLFGFNDAWYDVANKVGLRGSRLEVGRPYPSLAKVYGVNESEWMAEIVRATMVDPARFEAAGAPIVKALQRGRTVRVRDDHGTDLTLGLAHRKVQTDYGRLVKGVKGAGFRALNILPAGVVRVALDESVADGKIVASRPSYNDVGMSTGGVFRFRHGRLVSHHFDKGAAYFDRPYRSAGKGRDQPGYLAVGLNPELHSTPQMEDREAGAITVSVGANGFVGGKNKAAYSGIIVNVGATLEVDGKRVPLPG